MRLQFEDLKFDPDTRQIWTGAREVRLSPKAFDLLALLIARRPHAVSKADIRKHLWPDTFVSESSLPSLVSEIRDAIADRRRKPGLLRTVHGFGYAFQFERSGIPSAEAAAAPDAWLLGSTAEVALQPGENILGREGEGIVVKSSTVSRRHARLVTGSGGAASRTSGARTAPTCNNSGHQDPCRRRRRSGADRIAAVHVPLAQGTETTNSVVPQRQAPTRLTSGRYSGRASLPLPVRLSVFGTGRGPTVVLPSQFRGPAEAPARAHLMPLFNAWPFRRPQPRERREHVDRIVDRGDTAAGVARSAPCWMMSCTSLVRRRADGERKMILRGCTDRWPSRTQEPGSRNSRPRNRRCSGCATCPWACSTNRTAARPDRTTGKATGAMSFAAKCADLDLAQPLADRRRGLVLVVRDSERWCRRPRDHHAVARDVVAHDMRGPSNCCGRSRRRCSSPDGPRTPVFDVTSGTPGSTASLSVNPYVISAEQDVRVDLAGGLGHGSREVLFHVHALRGDRNRPFTFRGDPGLSGQLWAGAKSPLRSGCP